MGKFLIPQTDSTFLLTLDARLALIAAKTLILGLKS